MINRGFRKFVYQSIESIKQVFIKKKIFVDKLFRTGFLRHFFNNFYRSKRSILPNLAEEFVRENKGYFNYPIGYRVSQKNFLLKPSNFMSI